MVVKIVEDNFSKEKWDEVAQHPLQAWEWGEARGEMGTEVLRVGEFEENRLKSVYQITFHKIPFTNYKVGYLPRSKSPSKQILEWLFSYGKENHIVFIKIEPYEENSKLKSQSFNKLRIDGERSRNHQKSKLVSSPHPLFPKWTQVIDLTKSEEGLMANMKPKTRYNIRLAEKKGVIVNEMTNEEGFNLFIKLYFETAKRQNYFGHNLEYHKSVFENLKNNIAHILIAFYQEKPLAAYELFHFKDTLYYVYGGSSEEFRFVMAPHILMWESIRLGKKLGAGHFDMWGSLEPGYDEKHTWSGFTRFKEGFGGEFVQMIGSLDLVVQSFPYQLYSIIYKLREKYLTFKASF